MSEPVKNDSNNPMQVFAGRSETAVPPSAMNTRAGELDATRPSYQHILDAFAAHGAMTPDELAEKLARSVFYTRPRCSELRALGLLHATGERRPNAISGLPAEVLSL